MNTVPFYPDSWKTLQSPRRFRFTHHTNAPKVLSVMVLENTSPDTQRLADVDVFFTPEGIVVESFHKFHGELRYIR